MCACNFKNCYQLLLSSLLKRCCLKIIKNNVFFYNTTESKTFASKHSPQTIIIEPSNAIRLFSFKPLSQILVVLLNYEFLFRTCFIRILSNQIKCKFPYKLQLELKYLSKIMYCYELLKKFIQSTNMWNCYWSVVGNH